MTYDYHCKGATHALQAMPTIMLIDQHIGSCGGGCDDRGRYVARYLVPRAHDYKPYRRDLHKRLGDTFGDVIPVFRSCEPTEIDIKANGEAKWNNSNHSKLISVTTNLDLALKWAHYEAAGGSFNRPACRHVVKTWVDVEHVVFEGHSLEHELVVFAPYRPVLLTQAESQLPATCRRFHS